MTGLFFGKKKEENKVMGATIPTADTSDLQARATAAAQSRVVIPEHRREKNLLEARRAAEALAIEDSQRKQMEKEIVRTKVKAEAKGSGKSLFEIEGVYMAGDTTMIKGYVNAGRIKRNMKAKTVDGEVRVLEARKIREKVVALEEGEEGILIVSSKNNPWFKQGDVVEFK